METKGKIITTIGVIVIAIILIIFGIRLIGWFVQALLFGLGGFIIGIIVGYIWKGRIIKRKAEKTKE